MATDRVITAEEFMEAHGEQVLTALRSMVDFWHDARLSTDPTINGIAVEQEADWQRIFDRAAGVVGYLPPGEE